MIGTINIRGLLTSSTWPFADQLWLRSGPANKGVDFNFTIVYVLTKIGLDGFRPLLPTPGLDL